MTMDAERIGKYLRARVQPRIGGWVTDRWEILSDYDDVLGVVHWFPRWRQYTFDPAPETTYNDSCLTDLAAFLRRVNQARRRAP